MSDRKTMTLPEFIDKYEIPHSVIHKQSGISYQYLTKIMERRDTTKVMISCNVKTGIFRIYAVDMAKGTFDTDLFKKGEG